MRRLHCCLVLATLIFTALVSVAGETIVHAQGEVSFRARRDFRVGGEAWAITAGDFNGDGHLDLATANVYSQSLSVLLGTGSGAFRRIRDFDFGPGFGPVALASGDLNEDGDTDIAVHNSHDSVRILLGNGDGSFIEAEERVTVQNGGGSSPKLALGDFNEDGHLDLVESNSGVLSVFLGTGDGNFDFAQTVEGISPFDITVADFNNDDHLDVAIANRLANWPDPGTVSVLLGNGDGTLRSPAWDFLAGREPAAIAAGDFNGDGHPDLAAANHVSNTVSVLLGLGDGAFRSGREFSVGNGPDSIVVGDFNGDGHLDLATANINSDSVSVLSGKGNGAFQNAVHFGVGYAPVSLAAGDFNGDGRLDLATANWAGTVSILINISPRAMNEFVTFTPLPGTYATSSDTKGCPAGFAGTFRFRARLTNRPTSPPLEDLMVRVTTLTNGNLVQNADGGPEGVGAQVLVPRKQGYTDGALSPKESVEVPFVICLKKLAPFRLLVDVVEDGGE